MPKNKIEIFSRKKLLSWRPILIRAHMYHNNARNEMKPEYFYVAYTVPCFVNRNWQCSLFSSRLLKIQWWQGGFQSLGNSHCDRQHLRFTPQRQSPDSKNQFSKSSNWFLFRGAGNSSAVMTLRCFQRKLHVFKYKIVVIKNNIIGISFTAQMSKIKWISPQK